VSLTVRQIAEWVGGEIDGDADRAVQNPRTIIEAEENDFTFVDSEKHLKSWLKSRAGVALVPKSFPKDERDRTYIRVDDPLSAMIVIMHRLRPPREENTGIHPTAIIHPTAMIGPEATIGPYATIGEGTRIGAMCRILTGVVIGRHCHLGDEVTLHPHVVIYDDTVMGNRVTIHANSVIGADGFGYRPQNGKHLKIPQVGYVDIGDDVEIGACTTIDRGAIGATRIGEGTKIDNQVMIGHNCQIGKHNIMAGQVGIAGSCKTGDYVIMAGQVGIADHLTIGKGAILAAQSGYTSDVEPGVLMMGSPAMPGREYLRCVANWSKVNGLRREVAEIKKHLKLEEPK
jgi:UDP-3-O-[3-hydroxymyristoyl] glucosamine N-acyltransferase